MGARSMLFFTYRHAAAASVEVVAASNSMQCRVELYLASILGYGSAPALELTFSSSGHLFLLRGHAVTVTITFFLSKVRFGRLSLASLRT